MGIFSRMTFFGRMCVILLIFGAIGGVIYYTGFNKIAADYVNSMNGGEGSSLSQPNNTTAEPVATPAEETTQQPAPAKVDAIVVTKAGYGNSPLMSGNRGFVSSDNSIVVKDCGVRMKVMVQNDDKDLIQSLLSGEAQVGYCPAYLISQYNAKELKVLMEFTYDVDARTSDCLIAKAEWLAQNKAVAAKIAKAFIGVRTGDVKK